MKQSSSRPKGGKRPFQRRGDHRPRASAGQNRPSAAEDGRVWLFGVHAVEAALRNPKRPVVRLLMTENAEHRLAEPVAARAASPERVTPRDLDNLLGADTVHQGVMLETEPLPDLTLQDLLEQADTGPLIVLDQVTDPHNVGAILRSAAVFGAGGLVMTRRHSAPLDGTLAKSASGALELVPVALVQNLARTIDELKENGCLTLGLEGTSDAKIEDETFAGRVALVLGAEGKGLRELTRKSCERLVRISTAGPIASLNVSNAAAIALHHAAWKRMQG